MGGSPGCPAPSFASLLGSQEDNEPAAQAGKHSLSPTTFTDPLLLNSTGTRTGLGLQPPPGPKSGRLSPDTPQQQRRLGQGRAARGQQNAWRCGRSPLTSSGSRRRLRSSLRQCSMLSTRQGRARVSAVRHPPIQTPSPAHTALCSGAHPCRLSPCPSQTALGCSTAPRAVSRDKNPPQLQCGSGQNTQCSSVVPRTVMGMVGTHQCHHSQPHMGIGSPRLQQGNFPAG